MDTIRISKRFLRSASLGFTLVIFLLIFVALSGCNLSRPKEPNVEVPSEEIATAAGGEEAAGSSGSTEETEEQELVPPAPPANIEADHIAIYDVPLVWEDNSDNEDGFHIYRRRIDILSEPIRVGTVGKDRTVFLDGDTYCGATYQYIIASFNEAGESPSTACWQITLPPCPQTRVMRLGSGVERGRNFFTGALGETADFYMGFSPEGQLLFLADQEGQGGLVDVGNVGTTPLHHVALRTELMEPYYIRDGIPAVQGHTYVALARDGVSLIVFTLSEIGDPSVLEYILWQPGRLIQSDACQSVPGLTPGGPCVSGDGVCDPTCVPEEGRIGEPYPEDEFEDEFLQGNLTTAPPTSRRDGGGLFRFSLRLPFFQEPEPPPTHMEFTPPPDEPTYTEEDYDCGYQPCINGDDICNPLCDYGDPSGVEYLDQEFAAQTHYSPNFDSDCAPDPCNSYDGVCDPYCQENPEDENPEIETPDLTSRTDRDCSEPCEEDNFCSPNCTPFPDPDSSAELETGPNTYDPDCDQPCDAEITDCACEPVTEEQALAWAEVCSPGGTASGSETPGGGEIAGGQCGDGVCDPETENSDLCPQDCQCVDDGVCSPGEGESCRDCGETAGACGNPCTDSSQCQSGLACAGGVCWDACACGGDCETPPPVCEYVDCSCYVTGYAMCTNTCTGNTELVADPNC